jgi:hypothetical protein
VVNATVSSPAIKSAAQSHSLPVNEAYLSQDGQYRYGQLYEFAGIYLMFQALYGESHGFGYPGPQLSVALLEWFCFVDYRQRLKYSIMHQTKLKFYFIPALISRLTFGVSKFMQ